MAYVFTKTMRVMQITAFFLLGFCLHVAASGRAQQVTLSAKNVPLEQVLQTVERQTGVYFIYDAKLIQLRAPVSIDAQQMPLHDFLTLILKDKKIDFAINKNTVVLEVSMMVPKLTLPDEQPPITVKGRILNERNEPVLASVTIKGTNRGRTTNTDGFFEINNVDENAVLVISAANIETQEINVNGRSNININVATKINSEQEVTVSTGYWTTAKKLNTGNIEKISGKDIEKQPLTSPLMALQGRVAGLDILPRDGVAGTAPLIEIRGRNGLTSESYPLYIIDGVPIDSRPLKSGSQSFVNGGFDPLANINPSNIESIEVLKDGQATSIYGSRGANGVIIVKTKQGPRNGKMAVDINFYSGLGILSHKVKLLNTKQYVAMRKEAYSNDMVNIDGQALDLISYDTTRYTDWQNELLGESANITDGQFALSGGTENTSFRIGVGTHRESTIYPGNFGFNSFNGNLNLMHTSSNKRFMINLTMNYGNNKNKIANDATYILNALTLAPNAPELYTSSGELNWAIDPLLGYSTWQNPLSYLRTSHDVNQKTLFTNAVLSYEILPGLIIKTNLGYTDMSNNEVLKVPLSSFSPSIIGPFTTATATFGSNDRSTWLIEPQISYSKGIKDHHITINAGLSFGQNKAQYQSIQGTGYTSDALLDNPLGAGQIRFVLDASEYRYNSAYARLGYSFKSKYLFDLIGRRDGSSRFGPENRIGNFIGLGTGWIFSEENIFKNSDFLSLGKIRASYAITGNDQIGDYQFYNTYSISEFKYQSNVALIPSSLFNPDFKWEETKKTELGIELGFFKDRIVVSGSWYKNRSSNQLTNYQLPAITGFNAFLRNFDAAVENSGLEFTITSININRRNFKWTTSGNISIPRNKLVKFDNIESTPYAETFKVGEPLSLMKLYKWKGVNSETGQHEIVDMNEDGLTSSKDRLLRVPLNKDYFGGILNTFKIGNFDFSFLFQFSDMKVFGWLPSSNPGAFSNQPIEVLNRWQYKDMVSDWGKFSRSSLARNQFATYVRQSDRNIADASFIRLKTLSLSYTLPFKVLSKLKIQDAKLFGQGQNLWTKTDFIGFDPETGARALPPLKIFTLGVQVKL